MGVDDVFFFIHDGHPMQKKNITQIYTNKKVQLLDYNLITKHDFCEPNLCL